MKILTSANGFTISVDDADYEWASLYEWHVKQKDGLVHAQRIQEGRRNPIFLLREIAIRALGPEVIDSHTVVVTTSKNPLDCRRQYISVRKYIKLPSCEPVGLAKKAIADLTDFNLVDSED